MKVGAYYKMKKIISILALISIIFTMAIPVNATTYENSSFIGKWVAYGTDWRENAYLYVDYCDENRIKCRFETIKDGEVERSYDIYQCAIDDTKATSAFYTVSSSNSWFPSGKCTIELKKDMIDFSIVSSSNVTLYSGLFKSTSQDFDSQKSPYNHNVNILVNNAPINCELKPFILKDRTFVPLRGVFESLGVEVIWNDTLEDNVQTHEILAKKDGVEVSIKRYNKQFNNFGSWEMKKFQNDTWSEIDIKDVQPVIINDNSYIPLRAVVEALGTYIDWNDETRTVIISNTKPEEVPAPEPTEALGTGEADTALTDETTPTPSPEATQEPQNPEETQESETPQPTETPVTDDEK